KICSRCAAKSERKSDCCILLSLQRKTTSSYWLLPTQAWTGAITKVMSGAIERQTLSTKTPSNLTCICRRDLSRSLSFALIQIGMTESEAAFLTRTAFAQQVSAMKVGGAICQLWKAIGIF